ncbi:MAG: phosphatase PAP2 family protein [Gemmatimonadales bacterium]
MRRVDWMLSAYGVVVAAVGLTRLSFPGAALVVIAHLALPLLAWLCAHAADAPAGRFLRAYYPVILLLGLYSALDVLNRFGAVPVWDAPIMELESTLFGGQPARDWWRSAPSTFWSTLLHAVYFSYYLIVPLPILVFAARQRRQAIERYVDGLMATFLLCYLTYLLFPVAGPYYEFARPAGAFVANGPARLVYATLERGSAYGAAFPSSHVAATVAATVGAWRGSRHLGMILAVPTALLAVGVVYCQMHYAIDSIAGLALGLTVPFLAAPARRV